MKTNKETYSTDCSNCQVKPICGYGDVKCPETHHKKAEKLAAEIMTTFVKLDMKGVTADLTLEKLTELVENNVKEFTQ